MRVLAAEQEKMRKLKKGLDKRKTECYNKAPPSTRSGRRLVPCKLNNEEHEAPEGHESFMKLETVKMKGLINF